MPMFEENPGLVRRDSTSPPSRQRRQSPERPTTPSKPIAIPAASPIPPLSRRLSEESIRTELCEGPLPDSPSFQSLGTSSHSNRQFSPIRQHDGPFARSPMAPAAQKSPSPGQDEAAVSDRAELIERLKRGESPTWIPNRHLESLFHNQRPRSPTQSPRPPPADSQTTALLPAADITDERIPLEAHDHDAEAAARLEDGLNIERPRSALHSGDFTLPSSQREGSRTEEKTRDQEAGTAGRPFLPTEPSSPWLATSPPRHYTPFTAEQRTGRPSALADFAVFRSRQSSVSSSLSSSFVYQPPTSPLVQSESNYDEDEDDNGIGGHGDLSLPMNSIDIGVGSPASSLRSNPRRHTLYSSSHSQLMHSYSSPYPGSNPSQSLPRQGPMHFRRESQAGPIPYQAHQPRRSLSSARNDGHQAFGASSIPQTPLSRSRRTSFASDASPLQHASMVGSYEESILRGRMSTTPSKPLDFLAQIGVLGLGAKCKPSLRCPPHVTLPFSAVFYSYSSTPHGRSKTEDGPSPYVGMVDLENGLPHYEPDQRSKRKILRSRAATRTRQSLPVDGNEPGKDSTAGTTTTETNNGSSTNPGDDIVMQDVEVETEAIDMDRPTRASARSQKRGTVKSPPGGSYRIPQQGQLQIIIKNQNKTAVKLFLIPYDLTDMEPGTKTFIRQRSYSGGPIIDNVPGLAEAAASERPILRYLVHIHICCPSRGRYYLYNNMRVVFANRVPDGKEKLRNEIKFAEPRYSPYKPTRVMCHPMTGSTAFGGIGNTGPGAMLAAEKAYRRRSSGMSFAGRGPLSFGMGNLQHQQSLPAPMPIPTARSMAMSHQNVESFNFGAGNTPVEPMPFGNSVHSRLSSSASHLTSQTSSSYTPANRSRQDEHVRHQDGSHHSGLSSTTTSPPMYNKLNRGDVGYGGNAFVPMVNGTPVLAEGLLSQRLRSLDVQKNLPAKEPTENPPSE